MTRTLRIHGREVVVDGAWRARPRLLVDGVELPRDRLGRSVLDDGRGSGHLLETTFSVRHLTPAVRTDAETVLVDAPLRRGAWLLLGPLFALTLLAGALGAVLGILSTWLAARQLREGSGGWPAAACVVVLTVAGLLGLRSLMSAFL